MRPFFESIFSFEKDSSNMAILALEGAAELGKKVDQYLVNWYNNEAKTNGKKFFKDTFLVKNTCPRFTTGDGKGLILDSIRGKDLFIICDVGNYSIEYNMFGTPNRMSPDDHYSDLKRIIGACAGIANKITVIMPLLYGGRQHRRVARESLDCAQMLRELEFMGVKDIITFDAHDPRVQNSVPIMGFDNFMPTYQILKALLKTFPEINMKKDNFMIVSPDEGAMSRNIYYASVLGTDLGMFYKRRDYANVVNGRNPIVAHEYIGNDVKDKDIFVADDIIATGDSMLKLCNELKAAGCRRIFLSATYALFTEGPEKFQKAYDAGLFDAVLSTNLTYATQELLQKKWFVQADMSKFVAYIIAAIDQNKSVGQLLDPHDKIHELIEKFNAGKPQQLAMDISEE
ncbi:MAG: ribose-phosphate pyrophosphokinase [Clostridia bacterium]|nr:ribose-phosphate pyrophosphokinase [Clostridia bacterium]